MNITNYLKKIKPFSFKEKVNILKYSFGSVWADSIPKGLKHCYHFTQELNEAGIAVKSSRETIEFNYPVREKSIRFSLKRNSSDSLVFEQIIIEEEYAEVVNKLKQEKISISKIIDAGANIGLTTIYLKQAFPDAEIISLEPEKKTFDRLNTNVNLSKSTQVKTLNYGLWNTETELSIDRSFRDKQDWSVKLSDKNVGSDKISTKTILSILDQNNWKTIDLLKIDIEGAEKEVFLADVNVSKWLACVKVLALEIHDEVVSRKEIENLLIENGFNLSHSGELTIGINTKLINK